MKRGNGVMHLVVFRRRGDPTISQNACVLGGGALGLNVLRSCAQDKQRHDRLRRHHTNAKACPNIRFKVVLGQIRPGHEMAPVVSGEIDAVGLVVCRDNNTAHIWTLYSRRCFSSTRSTSGGAAISDLLWS